MNQNITINFTYKKCSTCKRSALEETFFRKGKVWKTCNECSTKTHNRRKAESAYATALMYENLRLRIRGLCIGEPIGLQNGRGEVQQRLAQMAERIEIERQHFEQQRQQQQDQRMTLEYLLADDLYDPAPLELYEQRRQFLHQAQQLNVQGSLQSPSNQQPVTYQNLQPELFQESFLTYPMDPNQGTNQGMLPDYEPLDPNLYFDFGADDEQQAGCSWIDLTGPGDQEIHFEECLANALRADLQLDDGFQQSSFDELDELFDIGMNRADSMFTKGPDDPFLTPDYTVEAASDVDMVDSVPIIAQEDVSESNANDGLGERKTPAKRVRKPRNKSPPFSLNEYFTDFNASADILRQPVSPDHDLTGAALNTHLISELVLAVRLAQMHRRWSKMKQIKWLKEVNVLVNLENKGTITPWGPLSDWLTLYELDMEDILDKYGHDKNLDWQAKTEVKVDMKRFAISFKAELRRKANELIEQNMTALLKLFWEGSGLGERMVKIELNKQLRFLEEAVVQDCQNNGVLRLKLGQWGTYVEG